MGKFISAEFIFPRCAAYRKGIRLIFLNRDADMQCWCLHGCQHCLCGNATELGDVAGMRPWEEFSFLFNELNIQRNPEIRLTGDRV